MLSEIPTASKLAKITRDLIRQKERLYVIGTNPSEYSSNYPFRLTPCIMGSNMQEVDQSR